MTHHPLRFIRRGQTVTLHNVPPDRTLLQVLREDLQACGTKEGCGEGDCGACTVVLAEAEHGALRYRAINSCIRLAHSIDGMALWTAEDIAQPDGSLHPAQEAMVQCHGSQCGFCTPGFVMSLFALYQKDAPVDRRCAQEALSGNLCRCTGYRPILDAAQHMASLPAVQIDATDLLQKLELLALIPRALEANLADLPYIAPPTLAELTAARAAHPSAQIVAGCTDVGLWVTKMHKSFARVIDVTQAAELREITALPGQLKIGAAVPLADAFAALVADRPQLHSFASRFAGLPVRNSGTLGGNVANGSPIGDSMPLLIALGAQVVLASQRGERTLPLEDLYTGYRTNVMAADEVLAYILVPKPAGEHRAAPGRPKQASAPSGGSAAHAVASVGVHSFMRVYKISKRFDDDISAVCLALQITVDNGVVTQASIGAGGVAATPVRAHQTQASLTGQPWTLATAQAAGKVLRSEFQPISDMRASAAYRQQVLGNLLQRFWLESQGQTQIDLATFDVEAV